MHHALLIVVALLAFACDGDEQAAMGAGDRDARSSDAPLHDAGSAGMTGSAGAASSNAGRGEGGSSSTGGAGGRGGSSGGDGSMAAGVDGSGAGGAGGSGGMDGPAGAVYPQPGQRKGPGVLPASLAGEPEYLGTLQYADPRIVRDLGYTGVVNGQIVWTFGDTLVENEQGGFTFVASDSAALGDLVSPLQVVDESLDAQGRPQEWIPLNADEEANGGLSQFAMGGTNVVEYAPNQGLVWFLKNHRGGGADSIVGAGVATVTADADGPIATRMQDTMWSADEPYWGDIGVTYNALDEHVYVFGHGPSSLDLKANVYLAKVPAAQAAELDAYRYWDQSKQQWGDQRFGDGADGSVAYTDAEAIFTFASHGQSNAFWSNHYNTWMFVHGADWPSSEVYVSTAPALEGPWSNPVSIGETCPPDGACGDLRYCIAPHPEFDASGKTLLVTWTDANVIHAVELEWQ